MSKVSVRPWDCWEWTGCILKDGYGRFFVGGSSKLAHRISYAELVGPIAADLQIDHLCRNHKCINPDHLEVVTSRENTLRGNAPAGRQSRMTHCKNGHPLSGENIYTSTGRRRCKICVKIYSDARYRKISRQKPPEGE